MSKEKQLRFFDGYNKIVDSRIVRPVSRVRHKRSTVNKLLNDVGLPSVEQLIKRGERKKKMLKWLEKKHQTIRYKTRKRDYWGLRFTFNKYKKEIKQKLIVNLRGFQKLIRYSKRLTILNFKNQLKKRLITVNYNQKYKKFEYRKKREEYIFYQTLINNLRVQILYPFLKRGRFERQLPKLTKPLKPTILTRRRFLQPIFIRLNYNYSKPHNGLRLRKQRRV